jgi:hypothetical protein
MAISPWHDSAAQDSPDGQFVAVYKDAMEIAMGGPTVGKLVISVKDVNTRIAEFPDANSSFVWSDDSTTLAFPRWTHDRLQRLTIVRVPSGRTSTLPEIYSVLELDSFRDGLVIGVDSPIHQPREIRVTIPS